jgi:hypothetical protein
MSLNFNRPFTETPGTSSFQLTDANGNPVPFSIDPFFFAYSIVNPSPPAGVSANMVLRQTGNGQYEISLVSPSLKPPRVTKPQSVPT